MQKTKIGKDEQRIKEEIILSYDINLYSEYEGEVTAKISDKVLIIDEYEEEIKFVENYIFRR